MDKIGAEKKVEGAFRRHACRPSPHRCCPYRSRQSGPGCCQRLPAEPDGEKADGAKERRVPKLRRGRRPDEDAVPDKGRAADQRHRQEPWEEGPGCRDDTPVRTHQAKQGHSTDAVEEQEEGSDAPSPAEDAPDGAVQPVRVPLPDKAAGKRFAGIGKSVGEVTEDHQELHQDGRDGEHLVPESGRQGREADIDGNHADAPKEQVPVETEETRACRCA